MKPKPTPVARCVANLRQIGVGLSNYMDEHQDQAPPLGNPSSFRALLATKAVKDPKRFLCPAEPEPAKGDPFRTTYRTWVRGTLNTAFAPRNSSRLPVAWDSGKHGGRRCVLFYDGHVTIMSEKEFQALLARWRPSMTGGK